MKNTLALETYLESQSRYERIGGKDTLNYAKLSQNIGNVYFN